MADGKACEQEYDEVNISNLENLMKRFVPFLFLLVSILLAACSSSQTDLATEIVENQMTQIDNQGAVTVSATPYDLEQPGIPWKFDISMETHSVELDMDLATLSTLTTDTGISILPSLWDAPRGGHHVSGTLSFPTSQDGKSVLDGAKQLTLTITGIDNATRTFTWDLNVR